jgi:hypothetical protein
MCTPWQAPLRCFGWPPLSTPPCLLWLFEEKREREERARTKRAKEERKRERETRGREVRGREVRGRRGKDVKRRTVRRKERGKESATGGHSKSLPVVGGSH